jgi:hypothetical protein
LQPGLPKEPKSRVPSGPSVHAGFWICSLDCTRLGRDKGLAAVRGPESRIQIQNPESKSGIQKSRIQNPESGMRIGPSGPRCSPCQNPESKSRIHDPDRTPSELSQAGAFSCEWSLRIQNQNPESSLEEYNSQYSSARCHYSAKIRRGNVGGCHLVSTQCHTHINTSTC